MRVGYAGLGLMGAPMARNLLRAGHEVTVWNRSPGHTEDLGAAGATVAGTPAEVGARAEVVAMCLPNGSVVEDVLFRADGVLAGLAPGGVVAAPTTIAPRAALRRAPRGAGARVGLRGAPPGGGAAHPPPSPPGAAVRRAAGGADAGYVFLDAPVSGGPHGAAAGELATMVGGDDGAFARALPVLDAYSAKVVHVGGSGSGQIAKLANQICIACTELGVAEAFALTGRHGLDPAVVFEVLTAATADSTMLRTRAPVPGLQPGMPASTAWAPGFRTDFMAKDLDFALADADAEGVPVAGTRLVRDLLARSQSDGGGALDWTAFSRLIG